LNCHRARQLISPYLDQQLTGRDMLALQQHFSECTSCEAERHSIRQVKMLLRSLHGPRPRPDLQSAISARLAEAEQPLWRVVSLTITPVWPPRPQRGRRLATALAFSCLTVFSFAAACFAPAPHGGAMATSGSLFSTGMSPTPSVLMSEASLAPLADVSRSDLLSPSEEMRRERLFASQYESQPELRLSSFPSGTVPDYIQGQVSFAAYRTR